ncbi:MAG: helix-turn-helix domain-containing protein [Ruminococcaceae bacterium]|jgi:membrane protein implicated in regulation of membrane protease activity/transcriptional regulator with XRE-family HTH domain|nr:helix-turn-helix domain-containing protein [Oscillospiraceae bacterium]
MSFGERLQEVRRGSGLTQEQFAEELNVSRQAVSKWESSRGYPEIEKILYICNRFQVPIGELFADEVPVRSAQEHEEDAAHPAGKLPSGNLTSAVSGFLANLSPKNKWMAVGVLAGIACLSALMALFLKGGTMNMETTVWIVAIVIFGVAEAMTAGLVSVWFVIGSVAALITAACGGAVWLQVVVFFVVSIAALLVTRPLVRRLSRRDNVATNADRVLGGTARVTEVIDNSIPTGAVYVDGKTWSARSEDGSVIPVGSRVRITRMEGVRLFVEQEL